MHAGFRLSQAIAKCRCDPKGTLRLGQSKIKPQSKSSRARNYCRCNAMLTQKNYVVNAYSHLLGQISFLLGTSSLFALTR
jgi:hypothetical protein